MEATSGPTRRSILQGGGAGIVGAVGLIACGANDGSGPGGDDEAVRSSAGSPSAAVGTEVPVADVPEGGSVYLADDTLILTQPSLGEFAAYDATCPHQACAVSGSEGAELVCPCHGSRFDIATGEVLSGPATRGLTALAVAVDGDSLIITS